MSMRSTPLRRTMSRGHDGDWECNDCGEGFTTNEASQTVSKIYCPSCGSGNIRQVM